MSYARYLKELLRPLGVYRLEGGLAQLRHDLAHEERAGSSRPTVG